MLFIACVIALAAFSSATGGVEVWTVVDAVGSPLADADVRSWAGDWVGKSDVTGSVAIPVDFAQEIVVAIPGRVPVAFDLAGLKDEGRTVLRYEGEVATPPRLETFEAIGVLRQAIGLAGAGIATDALRFPFVLGEGVGRASVELTWTPSTSAYGGVTLRANAAPRGGGAASESKTGDSPLAFALPPPIVHEADGEWELVVEAVDSVAMDVEVHARIIVQYGSVVMKRVEGARPIAPGEAEDETAPTMDILAATITDETESDFAIEILLEQAGTMEPRTLPFAHWMVEWVSGGERYFASMQAARHVGPSSALSEPRFDMGRCAPMCEAVRTVTGSVEWGAPGRIRMTIPKTAAGAPGEGESAEDFAAYTFESVDGAPTRPLETTGVVLVDAVSAVRPYRFGVAGLLAAQPLLATPGAWVAPTSAPGGWMPLAGGALLACVAGWAYYAGSAKRAGRYVRVRELGRGSNGVVFLARDTKMRRSVAMKVLHVTQGAALGGGLPHELEVLASLRHPNIVQMLDLETRGREVALVMEFVPGGDLARRIDTERVSIGEALALWMDVASGLAAAHAARIVHCDVKPSNVLLDADGRAKLADFGVARDATLVTIGRTSALEGTPLYMSPEQLRGEPVGPASDVFSAAAVAYRLLSGREIADVRGCRTPWDILIARQAAEMPPLPEGLPDDAGRLLTECLSADPHARPDAREVASRLGVILAIYGMPRYSSMT